MTILLTMYFFLRLIDIKNLRPRLFAAYPENADSSKEWLHWHKSFATYFQSSL